MADVVDAPTTCRRAEGSAGRDLEDQVDQRAPAQRSLLFLDLAVESDELLDQVEKTESSLARKPFDPQQMPLAEDER